MVSVKRFMFMVLKLSNSSYLWSLWFYEMRHRQARFFFFSSFLPCSFFYRLPLGMLGVQGVHLSVIFAQLSVSFCISMGCSLFNQTVCFRVVYCRQHWGITNRAKQTSKLLLRNARSLCWRREYASLCFVESYVNLIFGLRNIYGMKWSFILYVCVCVCVRSWASGCL